MEQEVVNFRENRSVKALFIKTKNLLILVK